MQMYKKQGLSQSENQLICSQKFIFLRGIPKNYVSSSKIELQHLQCYICQNIIWKATTCSQSNCFTSFCEACIQSSTFNNQQPKCPKCQKQFKKTSIPILNNLLSEITFKCPYQSNCQSKISYDGYLKHAINCDYRKVQCQGCHQYFFKKEIQAHQQNCSQIVIFCQKCLVKLPQIDFKQVHTQVKCLQKQMEEKTMIIQKLEDKIDTLKDRLEAYENMIGKIIRGQNLPLRIQFYSSFPTNFYFSDHQARLIRSSWNTFKQKYDFLHFYVTSPIKIDAPIGFQWKLQIGNLQGNLLIGICSSLSINSVDFVINRFGQIKKKQSSQNKYKLIRKSNITFSQGDQISFKYIALRKTLKIENQSKKVECKLEAKQIGQLGQNLYSFYSLDTVNDYLKFY